MITEFSKGFTDRRIHEAYKRAVLEGDCDEISAVVKASGMQRRPVDCFINALNDPDGDVSRTPLAAGVNASVNSTQYYEELMQVQWLSKNRDMDLDDVPMEMPRGLREVSYILKQYKVPKYAEGVDYMTTKEDFDKVQSGQKIEPIMSDGTTRIKTGRDAASYVHADDPLMPWVDLVKKLFKEECRQVLPNILKDDLLEGQTRFTVFGFPFVMGLMGEALRRGGLVSFRTKYREFFPRPEEMGPLILGELLSQAYPEGSPDHPSRVAMHSFIAYVMYYIILKLFNNDHRMADTGETLAEEALLLRDNIGMWRFWAGVHTMSDHLACDQKAEAIAQKIVASALRG